MSITRKEVQHIAHLARIELTREEEERYENELSAILGFVEKLNEVDTTGVAPMTGGTEEENLMRGDEAVNVDLEGKQSELLEAVPEKKGGWVKVKKVFE